MGKMNQFIPDWIHQKPVEKSYRSIFKWGDPSCFKHPNIRLYGFIKEYFGITDADFSERINDGNIPVDLDVSLKSGLSDTQIKKLEEIAGKENVAQDDYSRVRYAYGKTMEEAMDLRECKIEKHSWLVVHPRNRHVVESVIAYCCEEKIPVYPYGGGSSVNLGFSPVKGGITLCLASHMNRVISFNEKNQTITVESGMSGPELERVLNQAKEIFKAEFDYTCGHFPQSFEFSTVGGWIMAKGSGQNSSYYGDACDLVISQEVVTPAGSFKTLNYPGTATGPMVNDVIKGSEGTFGVLTSVTLKVFRYMPENRFPFAFVFPDWKKAVKAAREISLGEFGMPSMFRISDAEETVVGFKQHGIEGSMFDKILKIRGFSEGLRCLCMGHTEGEKKFSKHVYRQIRKICKRYGAMYISGYPVKKWEKSRFTDPYMREDLHDYGIVIDTLETSVTWDNIHKVHADVRDYIKKRKKTVCMTHCSHFYSQGTNLYFIMLGRFHDKEEYKAFQMGVLSAIEKSGGSLSHHHGVGKMAGPLMEDHLGREQMDVLKALKHHFDPEHIMNPGGTLGLD